MFFEVYSRKNVKRIRKQEKFYLFSNICMFVWSDQALQCMFKQIRPTATPRYSNVYFLLPWFIA